MIATVASCLALLGLVGDSPLSEAITTVTLTVRMTGEDLLNGELELTFERLDDHSDEEDLPAASDEILRLGLKRRVLIIVRPGCKQCNAKLNELERNHFPNMRYSGWRIGSSAESHIQIVSANDVADLVATQKVKSFPAVVAVHSGHITRSFTDGCNQPLDFWTFNWLLNGGKPPHGIKVSAPTTVVTTGHYPLRGSHWSIDGDYDPPREVVVEHLFEPQHVDLFPADWDVHSWSYEELRSLHDDLHESYAPKDLLRGDGVNGEC